MTLILYVLLAIQPNASSIQIEMLPQPQPRYVLPIDRPKQWRKEETI
jgi:hypothetical protein